MRKSLVFAVSVALMLLAPAAAQAHHANGTATCDKATVNLVSFNWNDKSQGVDITVKIDGQTVATKHVDPFQGSDKTVVVTYPKPADSASHTVHVYIRWKTGDDDFSETVSNCCPTPPPPPTGPCCVDGLPGPVGPAGPAGPSGSGTDTQRVVERVIVQTIVVEKSCTSKRVYKFLVKRWHRVERPGEKFHEVLARRKSDLRIHETGFRVTKKIVKRGGHRRWLITVRPPVGGKKNVTRGQLFATNLSIKLKGRKGWVEVVERRRLCMEKNGSLNHPAASGPARG